MKFIIPMSYSRYSKFSHIQPLRIIPNSITDIRHVLKQYETIDQLALKYYNDPNLEWVIMCANPDHLLSFAIPAGTELRIAFPLSRVFNAWGMEGEI